MPWQGIAAPPVGVYPYGGKLIDSSVPADGGERPGWLGELGELDQILDGALPLLPIDLNGVSQGPPPWLSVVIPTRNEEKNVDVLLDRLRVALAAVSAEIIFVDDSDDGTPRALASHAMSYPVRVRLLHRSPR